MRAACLALLILAPLFLAPGGAAFAQASQEGPNELLRSARLWESSQRGDLARVALEKYLHVAPDDARALLMLGELEVRSNHAAAAEKVLARLRAAHAGDPAVRYLEDALRIGTRDRLKMATVDRLVQIRHNDEAVAQLRALFPGGPAGGELGIEYSRILAHVPAHAAEVDAGYRRLLRENPDDPLYQLALANHLTGSAATRKEGLRMLADLAAHHDVDRPRVLSSWRDGVLRLPATPASRPLIRDYLAAAPDDSEVREHLARVRTAPPAKLPEATPASAAAKPPSAATRAAALRKRGDAVLAAGHGGDALRLLEQAQVLVPEDPWLRYDLAKLYLGMQLPDEARALMAEGVALAPADADMRFADALLLSSLDDEDAALDQLQKVAPARRSDGMLRMESRLLVNRWCAQALELARAGTPIAAANLLREAQLRAGDNRELLAKVAAADIDTGAAPAGIALMRGWMRRHAPAPVDAELGLADLLDRARADDELERQLAALRKTGLNAEQRSHMDALQLSHQRRAADALVAQGRYSEAQQLFTQMLQQAPGDAPVLAALAEVDEKARRYQEARAIEAQLVARNPDDLGARLDHARLLRLTGEPRAAGAELDEVLRRAPADDVDDRLAVARQRLALDDVAGARAALAGIEPGRDTAAVLLQAGRIERAGGNYDEALSLFRRAAAAARAPAVVAANSAPPGQDKQWRNAEAEIREIEQRRHGYAAAGINHSGKPGDPGISQYTATELALEARRAQGYRGHWFALVDPVRVDAGQLPGSYDGAGLYGKNAAFGPAGYQGNQAQSANGTAVGLGWESDDWRIDLGTTPVGFLVQDVVGGVRYDGRVGVLNYTLDAARRPLTSSLLSYAGARDPVTGQVWGGARSVGLDSRLAYYGERYSASASLGLHEITGRNLPGNSYRSARLAGDWRFYDAPDTRLYAGLAATYWGYGLDLSHYTFGQGGYYSPQTYLSLSLPLEWTGRQGEFSWRLRGSGSISHTATRDSPFFPHDAALQEQASHTPLPQGYGLPVFGGRSGSGHGYTLAGNVEYRLLPRWFVGGLFQIDRSAYYTPNFLSAYLRYDFDLQQGAVLFPPRPPRSYSQF